MRKLLNTLYVISDDLYLSLENNNVIVTHQKEVVNRIPMHTLESIVIFNRKGISIPLMEACARNGVQIFLLSYTGQMNAVITGHLNGNVALRKAQYCLSLDEQASISLAGTLVQGKLANMVSLLCRYSRNHSNDTKEEWSSVANKIRVLAEKATTTTRHETLLGLEGEASALYFDMFGDMIRNPEFQFQKRSQRPPHDPVNALLSFAYVLLTNICVSAAENSGLDPYIGFLHQDHPGRFSLACDLVEEFRQSIADRFVLNMLNNRIIRPQHFERTDENAVFLNSDGKRILITQWQKYMQNEVLHPTLKENVRIGLIPFIQASALTSYITGSTHEYKPFIRT